MDLNYVIIGAGLTGCAVANRLSESGCYRVAVLEAGGLDSNPWLHGPVGYFKTMGNPKSEWRYKTEQDPGIANRSFPWPCGRVLGGSSSINGVHGLRIADASIMPLIVSGNTNAPAIVIGEKASALVLENPQ